MVDSDLSVSARRRALRLRLKRIHRKIAKVEEEIRTRSFNWFA